MIVPNLTSRTAVQLIWVDRRSELGTLTVTIFADVRSRFAATA